MCSFSTCLLELGHWFSPALGLGFTPLAPLIPRASNQTGISPPLSWVSVHRQQIMALYLIMEIHYEELAHTVMKDESCHDHVCLSKYIVIDI